MAISNRLEPVKMWLGLLWLGCALFSFGCAHDEDFQTILRSISGIMVAEEEEEEEKNVMDRDRGEFMDRDKGEFSISRILSARNPGCRDSNNYAFE